MKTLNQFRATNKICVLGDVVHACAAIAKLLQERGDNLVALAHDSNDFYRYTARVIGQTGYLADHLIDTFLGTRVVETVIIRAAGAAAKEAA